MCIIFASCIFFSYGFTICSVCVINENKNVLKSYYSTSDITTALSHALDYTKNNANKPLLSNKIKALAYARA